LHKGCVNLWGSIRAGSPAFVPQCQFSMCFFDVVDR
jgi:hypothetical protein